jgi:hypothetical protein
MTAQLAITHVDDSGLALTQQQQTALAYARGALFNPVSLSVMAFALCVGVGYAGVLGALVALATFVTLAVTASRHRYVQAQLDMQHAYRVRQKREAGRMRLLKPAGPVRQQQYADVRDRVAEIERTGAFDAERFELQELLDHFVSLAVCHQNCLDALRLAGSSDLPRAMPLPDAQRSHRRREIMRRRLHHRDACLRRIERIADELEAIDELVRLVAQRVAAANVGVELDREIDRRLWELDEIDAALSSLRDETPALAG